MNLRPMILSAALALAATAPASAQAPKPLQAQPVALGAASGIAYYTVEPDGYRLVVTLARPDETALPLRVEALLAPGQSVVLSTPREAGIAPEAVEISRRDDAVLVRKVSGAVTN